MVDSAKSIDAISDVPQCQHFVVRKKRLCRMTVRPGRQYCGEHEPQPKTEDGNIDKRVPCPNDPKHTCYISKLEKHLTICNARQGELPPYMVPHINAPVAAETYPRKPLGEIPKESIMLLVDKVNSLYEKHIKDNISAVPERPIHWSVLAEFNEADRTESSLRHLRQASRLLWLAEEEGLVENDTCYVELGAGKGQMSYYMGVAWCAARSRVLAVDRAALRHKRDGRLRALGRARRLRADLAHLALAQVPLVQDAKALVGLAKHLCGVATDFALRCLTGAGVAGVAGVAGRARGAVLATCCHHRCEQAHYVANDQLQELGISGEELNSMLGVVSWATCGDGRSRAARPASGPLHPTHLANNAAETASDHHEIDTETEDQETQAKHGEKEPALSQEVREQVGRRAKALLDWGRVLFLRGQGFDAKLCYYVPRHVSPENVCIVAKALPR